MTQAENNAGAIASVLAQYVAEEILADGTLVELDENLLSDGLVDSLGMLRLVGFIEASFEIKIAPDQFTIVNFRDLNVISRYVARLVDDTEIAPMVHSISGRYDLIAQYNLAGDQDIGRFVNEQVHPIPGIVDTETVICFNAFTKDKGLGEG